MDREPRAYVQDNVEACDAVAYDIHEVPLDAYVANRQVRSAVKRELVTIGEAVNVLGDLDKLVWAFAVRKAPQLGIECAALLAELDEASAD